jgi:hypothetical protein
MAMDAERTVKILFAPLAWGVLTLIWSFWFLVYLVFAPRHLREIWYNYTDSLGRVLGD